MRRPRFCQAAAAALAALALHAAPPCRADFLDPANFTSIGTLSESSGTYVFNTSNDTLTQGGTTLFTGVTVNGVAVFDFASINITGGTFTVTGSNPLALLSQGNLSFTGGSLSANGGDGTSNGGGIGVGGGGNGGNIGAIGSGPGAGSPSTSGYAGGGGGGFGGGGGNGYLPSGSSGAGGGTYGTLTTQLVAGSRRRRQRWLCEGWGWGRRGRHRARGRDLGGHAHHLRGEHLRDRRYRRP